MDLDKDEGKGRKSVRVTLVGDLKKKGGTRPTPECILRACTTSYELEGYGKQSQSRLQSSNLNSKGKTNGAHEGREERGIRGV
jgi:hypothetical protein